MTKDARRLSVSYSLNPKLIEDIKLAASKQVPEPMSASRYVEEIMTKEVAKVLTSNEDHD